MKKNQLVELVVAAQVVAEKGISPEALNELNAQQLHGYLAELLMISINAKKAQSPSVRELELEQSLVVCRGIVAKQEQTIKAMEKAYAVKLEAVEQLENQITGAEEDQEEDGLPETVDDAGMPVATNHNERHKKALCTALKIRPESFLWNKVLVRQNGLRFEVRFPQDVYEGGKEACYAFLGRLKNVVERKKMDARFEGGKLVIIARNPERV